MWLYTITLAKFSMWLYSITSAKPSSYWFFSVFHSELKDTVMSIPLFMFKQSSPAMTEASTVKS